MTRAAAEILIAELDPACSEALRQRLGPLGLRLRQLGYLTAAEPAKIGRPDVAVVLVDPEDRQRYVAELTTFLDVLAAQRIRTVVLGSSEQLCPAGGAEVQWLGPNVSLDEVTGRLATLSYYEPIVRRLERELSQVQKLGTQLNRYFGEIDQEMRLAGRLQHDFLPQVVPHHEPLSFGVLYRPASWVSGDIYDILKIDDEHVGLFVADAMGHGVAAGLLTMFIRQALATTRGEGANRQLVPPAEALAVLNQALVRQKLPNTQFVTAAYAVINRRTLKVQLARAGHPYPLLMSADGSRVTEITPGGGLLGLPGGDDDFEQADFSMAPGEKLVLYTDGVEDVILAGKDAVTDETRFTPALLSWAGLNITEFMGAFGGHIDNQEGSLNPADDVTVIGTQVDPVMMTAGESK